MSYPVTWGIQLLQLASHLHHLQPQRRHHRRHRHHPANTEAQVIKRFQNNSKLDTL